MGDCTRISITLSPSAVALRLNSLPVAIMATSIAPKDVHTTFPYLARDAIYQKEKPYATDFILEDSDVALTNHVFDFMNLVVRDAQPQRDSFSLQKNGFCFLKAMTSLSNENVGDEHFLEKTYFDEIEEVLHDKFPEYTRIECLDYQVSLSRNREICRLTTKAGTQKKLAVSCTTRCSRQKRSASSLAAH